MDRTGGETEASGGKERYVRLNGFRFFLDTSELLNEAGEPVQLRPQCQALLCCLAEKPGRVVTKEDLMRAVWPDVVVTDDSLVQCVSDLRQALRDPQHRLVQTEHRRGYRLMVSTAAGEETPAEATPACSKPDGASPQEFRFAASADGVRIAYADCGKGIPVVRAPLWISHLEHDLDCLTHGPLLRAVARHHRLIRFDQRGQGLSDRHVLAGTVEQAVADLRAVVDAAEVSRFVLWAIGAGAASAVRFAGLYPERVERLILSAGWAHGVRTRRDARWTQPRGEATLKLIGEFWDDENPHVRSLITARQFPRATLEQIRSYDEMLRRSCSAAVALSATVFNIDYDVTADLGKVRCPTLVTCSRGDLITPFDEVRLIVAGIPNARLVTLDSDNFIPLPQEPAWEALTRLIDDFIEEGACAWRATSFGHRAEGPRREKLRIIGRPGGG
jgi:pimeloyl-ACP methyl ester carboxylesterase/DNA-binding winged helix-turn-helix (wHTH) protein